MAGLCDGTGSENVMLLGEMERGFFEILWNRERELEVLKKGGAVGEKFWGLSNLSRSHILSCSYINFVQWIWKALTLRCLVTCIKYYRVGIQSSS